MFVLFLSHALYHTLSTTITRYHTPSLTPSGSSVCGSSLSGIKTYHTPSTTIEAYHTPSHTHPTPLYHTPPLPPLCPSIRSWLWWFSWFRWVTVCVIVTCMAARFGTSKPKQSPNTPPHCIETMIPCTTPAMIPLKSIAPAKNTPY